MEDQVGPLGRRSRHLSDLLASFPMPMITDPLVAVKRHASDLATDKQQRDIAIKWARMTGSTYRQIADAAGLTPAGVAKIIKRGLDNSVDGSTL